MKKRVIALALVGAMAFSMVACGKKDAVNDKTEGVENADAATEEANEAEIDCTYDFHDYVTLGDYKGIEVTLDGEYQATKEGLASYIDEQVKNAVPYMEDETQTVVAEDSIVNVDYVGSKDDVPFDGGSAEDQLIDVKNNSGANGGGFIEGFTAGLPGHEVGEEVAYEVTFPENYQAPDLAGQTVVFTFVINYIAKPATVADLNDDNVSKYFLSYANMEEFNNGLEEKYNEELAKNLQYDSEEAVINAVVGNATINGCPEGLLQARVDMYISMMEGYLNGATLEEYVQSFGGNYEDYLKEMRDSLTQSIQQQLVFEAVAEAEGLTVDEAEFKDYVESVMQYNSVTNEEDFYKNYAIGNLDGREYFKTIYLADQAMKFCVDNAVVNY